MHPLEVWTCRHKIWLSFSHIFKYIRYVITFNLVKEGNIFMHLSFPYPLTNGVVKTICERYIDETCQKELKTKELITLYLFYRYNNLLHYKKNAIACIIKILI